MILNMEKNYYTTITVLFNNNMLAAEKNKTKICLFYTRLRLPNELNMNIYKLSAGVFYSVNSYLIVKRFSSL